jgi:sugar phosphate isomerase/epimerase
MSSQPSRRDVLAASPAALALGAAPAPAPAAFHFCLNTSTLRGQDLGIVREVEIAARAGYTAIEPWIDELEKYAAAGGSLKDLGKRIRDAGLTVADAIGFAEWVVDDDARRRKGLENARRAMDLVQQVGGQRIAAPPAGATDAAHLDLFTIAERYRVLLEIGDKVGVVPQVEVWGFSKCLGRLGEAALVAVESRHPKACVLADVYHLYKGGSGIEGVRLLSAAALQVLHMNDYPADPPRERITDAHRVYPGDGVAPLKPLLREMRGIGFSGFLSLELFNREYWMRDALHVARTGLDKMRALAEAGGE